MNFILPRIFSLLIALLLATDANASSKWRLQKESDGIKLYTKELAGSDVKALRAELTTKGTAEQLAQIILDIDKQKDWVYSTKWAKPVKRISADEIIYHTEKDMPWPASDRDAVVHVKINREPNGAMTVTATSVNGYVPAQKDIVRVPSSKVIWKVTPLSSNTIRIEYEAEANPGGSIPSWVTNMFLTKGPLESFKKLKTMLAG